MTEHANPYESPTTELRAEREKSDRRASVVRGIAYSIPHGLLGAVIPSLYFLTLLALRWLSGAQSEFLISDFDWDGVLPPSIGCGIVFALSAIRNHAPAIQIGIIRSLMWVGGSFVLGGFLARIAAISFGLEPVSYDSDPWAWLRLTIALAVPAAYAFCVIRKEVAAKRGKTGTNAA